MHCPRVFVFRLAVQKGRAKAWDHAQVVHQIWEDLLMLRVHVFVCRVATDDNIADLPSRTEFALFPRIGAVESRAVLPSVYGRASTWEVLHERWAVHWL